MPEVIIGDGAVGTVYRALDERTGERVALKVLASTSVEARKRFHAEARTLATLDHPAIIRVRDVGEDPDTPWFTMDIARGGTVRARLRRSGAMPPRQACALVQTLLGGVAHAHDMGVVHRDIKPSNILLGEDGSPLVGDFGIARRETGGVRLTGTGSLLGTVAYMAPEQRADTRSAGPRADLFSVGATLFTMVTDQAPFDLYAPKLQDRLLAAVPEPLAAVIRRAVAYDPADRYASAAEMAADVGRAREALPPDPVDAPPLAAPLATRPLDAGLFALAPPSTPAPLTPALEPQVEAPRQGPAPADVPRPSARRSPVGLLLGVGGVVALAAAGWVFWPAADRGTGKPGVEVPGAETPDAGAPATPASPVAAADPPPSAAAPAPEVSLEAAAAPTPAASPVVAVSAPEPPTPIRATTREAPPPGPEAAPAEAAPSVVSVPVRLNTRPWSRVTIDGVPAGRTGWRGELEAGTHRLSFTNEQGEVHRRELVVEAGADLVLCWDFAAAAECGAAP